MDSKSAEESLNPVPEGVVVYNRFIRNRNVLLSEVDMSALFRALESHCETHQILIPKHLSALFRDLFAAATLHGASRPRNELMAWTIRYADPLVSFFFGVDTEIGSVVGRYFEQNVKEAPHGEMHQELHRGNKPPHLSMIEFRGETAKDAVNTFYEQSEQRPARFLWMGGSRYALASAHPDYDEGWFTHLNEAMVKDLPDCESLNLLEERQYYWLCGCSKLKIMEMLAPMMGENPEAIFGDDANAQVNCPRCAATYSIERMELQRLADERNGSE